MPKIYCALFLGQGGRIFSGGVMDIARRLRAMGCTVDVFAYTNIQTAHARIDWFRAHGHLIVFFGFSLGTSTVTYLQGRLNEGCILLLSVPMSMLEPKWPINHHLVTRSLPSHAPLF